MCGSTMTMKSLATAEWIRRTFSVELMDCPTVNVWLYLCRISRYEDVFQKLNVDTATVLEVTREQLEGAGVVDNDELNEILGQIRCSRCLVLGNGWGKARAEARLRQEQEEERKEALVAASAVEARIRGEQQEEKGAELAASEAGIGREQQEKELLSFVEALTTVVHDEQSAAISGNQEPETFVCEEQQAPISLEQKEQNQCDLAPTQVETEVCEEEGLGHHQAPIVPETREFDKGKDREYGQGQGNRRAILAKEPQITDEAPTLLTTQKKPCEEAISVPPHTLAHEALPNHQVAKTRPRQAPIVPETRKYDNQQGDGLAILARTQICEQEHHIVDEAPTKPTTQKRCEEAGSVSHTLVHEANPSHQVANPRHHQPPNNPRKYDKDRALAQLSAYEMRQRLRALEKELQELIDEAPTRPNSQTIVEEMCHGQASCGTIAETSMFPGKHLHHPATATSHLYHHRSSSVVRVQKRSYESSIGLDTHPNEAKSYHQASMYGVNQQQHGVQYATNDIAGMTTKRLRVQVPNLSSEFPPIQAHLTPKECELNLARRPRPTRHEVCTSHGAHQNAQISNHNFRRTQTPMTPPYQKTNQPTNLIPQNETDLHSARVAAAKGSVALLKQRQEQVYQINTTFQRNVLSVNKSGNIKPK